MTNAMLIPLQNVIPAHGAAPPKRNIDKNLICCIEKYYVNKKNVNGSATSNEPRHRSRNSWKTVKSWHLDGDKSRFWRASFSPGEFYERVMERRGDMRICFFFCFSFWWMVVVFLGGFRGLCKRWNVFFLMVDWDFIIEVGDEGKNGWVGFVLKFFKEKLLSVGIVG